MDLGHIDFPDRSHSRFRCQDRHRPLRPRPLFRVSSRRPGEEVVTPDQPGVTDQRIKIDEHAVWQIVDFRCENSFRAIRTDVLRALPLRENSTTIEQEMIMLTLLKGYRLGEVPAHEHARRYGESKIRLHRVCWRYAWSLVIGLFFRRART